MFVSIPVSASDLSIFDPLISEIVSNFFVSVFVNWIGFFTIFYCLVRLGIDLVFVKWLGNCEKVKKKKMIKDPVLSFWILDRKI